jgi:hypothetical protein
MSLVIVPIVDQPLFRIDNQVSLPGANHQLGIDPVSRKTNDDSAVDHTRYGGLSAFLCFVCACRFRPSQRVLTAEPIDEINLLLSIHGIRAGNWARQKPSAIRHDRGSA